MVEILRTLLQEGQIGDGGVSFVCFFCERKKLGGKGKAYRVTS